MKLPTLYQKISEIGKEPSQKQQEISVSEVWHLHGHLIMRYDVLETTNIIGNYAQSPDLKLLLSKGTTVLEAQVKTLETLMKEYDIPLPERPPYGSKSTANVEIINDRYIFRRIYRGIQSFIPIHAGAFTQSTLPKIREQFKTFLMEEIELFNMLVEYGKIKGFEEVPPKYRV